MSDDKEADEHDDHPTPDDVPVLGNTLLTREYGKVVIIREEDSSSRWVLSDYFVLDVEQIR